MDLCNGYFLSNVHRNEATINLLQSPDVKKFYKYLDQHKVKFINEINEQLIEGTRLTYTTSSQCSMFIDAVVKKLQHWRKISIILIIYNLYYANRRSTS